MCGERARSRASATQNHPHPGTTALLYHVSHGDEINDPTRATRRVLIFFIPVFEPTVVITRSRLSLAL